MDFIHEKIELAKVTVLGIAEETSASLVTTTNDLESPNTNHSRESSRGLNAVGNDSSFRQYMKDRVGHLTCDERSVIEPVLMKYRQVFHIERSNDFQGTYLAEHRIVTGDEKAIRKKNPYRVPFSLRKEMDSQVQDMLDKGIVEESNLPWSAQAILVRKTSLDGMPKNRFCVDFRVLKCSDSV